MTRYIYLYVLTGVGTRTILIYQQYNQFPMYIYNVHSQFIYSDIICIYTKVNPPKNLHKTKERITDITKKKDTGLNSLAALIGE